MAKKQWYTIEVECVKVCNNTSCYSVGEKFIVAKIKSIGVAYIVAKHLHETTYKKDNFVVRVL